VLHTDAARIFALAYGQRGLAFRFAPATRDAVIAGGGSPADDIGRDWFKFDPWNPQVSPAELQARLERWSARAFAESSPAGTK
jgi:hypothetical protein